MTFRNLLLCLWITGSLLPVIPLSAAEIPAKPPPRQWTNKPHVVVEWQETVEDCEKSKICIQGLLHNDGGKPALDVHLRIELGGTTYIRPRLTLTKRVDQSIMNPGDRQDFYVEIDRKISYRSRKKSKIFEVGKFNYKIVPTWAKKGQLTIQ